MAFKLDNLPLRLIGGLRIGPAPEGDYSFYADLFARLPDEVGRSGQLTRYVAFDVWNQGPLPLTFLGIEVGQIDAVPTGLMAWVLDDDALRVADANGVIHEGALTWDWREQTPDAPCPVTGEFQAVIPANWTHTGEPTTRQFAITANAYVAPGRPGHEDAVRLVDHDPDWPKRFDAFTAWLQDELGNVALRIDHIGSTAIPGIPAKPIIDVMVQVSSFAEAKSEILPKLNRPDWEYWRRHDKMTFIKRAQCMGERTHHVHIMTPGPAWQAHLDFRDYLRQHSDTAAEYAAFKQTLAKCHTADREKYTDAKSSFVQAVVTMANTQ